MEKSSFSFKKILKIISVVALVLVICGVILVVVILKSLPSAKEIGHALNLTKNKTVKTQVVSQTQIATAEIPAASHTELLEVVSGTEVAGRAEEQKKQTKKNLFEDFADPEKPLSQFCDVLQNARPVNSSVQDSDRGLRETDRRLVNPKHEPFKTLLRSIFRLPAITELLNAINDAEKNGQLKDDFLSKAQFYGQATLAFGDMMSHRDELNTLGDKTYLQMMLNAAVASKKEIYQDQRLRKFCEDIERSINNNEAFSFDQEKKNLERVLDELQINHQAIGYNPNYKSNFDITFNNQSLTFSGGWLDTLLKPKSP